MVNDFNFLKIGLKLTYFQNLLGKHKFNDLLDISQCIFTDHIKKCNVREYNLYHDEKMLYYIILIFESIIESNEIYLFAYILNKKINKKIDYVNFNNEYAPEHINNIRFFIKHANKPLIEIEEKIKNNEKDLSFILIIPIFIFFIFYCLCKSAYAS
jgi:hypothetical protein